MTGKKSLLLVGIVIMAALLVTLVDMPEYVQANGSWHVDDDGGKDFTKIQDAINASSE